MTKQELKDKIKAIVKAKYAKSTPDTLASSMPVAPAVEYDELTKFPELKRIIVDLLTVDYARFIDGIDWVAPRPTTFRINLLNGQSFYLIYGERSWIAQVEGKKYYLLNLSEEQNCIEAIARILSYGGKAQPEKAEGGETPPAESPEAAAPEAPAPEAPAPEAPTEETPTEETPA